VNTLLSARADSVCGADYGARSAERVNRRNGYRHRDLDNRVGTLDVELPKLREGSFFPDWLLQRRRRAEAALTTVVAVTCWASPPGGWTSWCSRWGSPACQSLSSGLSDG
jgi:transposase-like protein